MNRQCSNCRWWAGVDEDDVADCQSPLPEAIENHLEWYREDPTPREIAGDRGRSCPHWESAS
jgi:hypothetical protein